AKPIPLELPAVVLPNYRNIRVVPSAEGSRFVTAFENAATQRTEVRVWDAETGKPIGPALSGEGEIWHTELNKDASQVLVVSRRELNVWPVTSGKLVRPPFRYKINQETSWSMIHGNWRLLTVAGKGDNQNVLHQLAFHQDTLEMVELPAQAKVEPRYGFPADA